MRIHFAPAVPTSGVDGQGAVRAGTRPTADAIDWRAALAYVPSDRTWARRIGVGGLLMLALPPVGWILALGYRSVVGNRLVDGCVPVLPAWHGNVRCFLRRGVMSSGVILGYLAPFLIGYWVLGVGNARDLIDHPAEIAAFGGLSVIFPPLAIPTLPILYAVRYPWLHFSAAEMCVLAVLFLAPILLMPAAFLQVAHHRRFRAAFNVAAAVRLVASVPRLYVDAWMISLAVSAVSVAIVPLTPWLLFWSYMIISHVFLQVLAAARCSGGLAKSNQLREGTD